MSQLWDILVDGVTTFGAAYGKINDMLQSLRCNFSGTSFPSGAAGGQSCWRTDRKLKYVYTDDALLGEAGWVEVPIASAGIGLEIVTARGTKATLDQRLDMAMNEDGTLKAPVTVTPNQWFKPFQKHLNYDAQTGNFTAGRTLTGGTSGATAVISSDVDGGTTGTLFLSNVVGTFQNNEAITDGIGGAATADGTVAAAFEYVGTASFKVKAENATDIYVATRRLKINLSGSVVYAEVASSSYGSGDTTVVVSHASANLDNTLVDVEHSILLPATDAADGGKGAISPRMIGQHANHYAADTGAADAYTCTLDPAPTAWFVGLKFSILIAHANTGASTVAPNGLAVKNIKKNVSAALIAGDLPVGGIANFEYDGTNVQLINPSIVSISDGTNLIYTKIIAMGDWDMDAISYLVVNHGIADYTKIRTVSAMVFTDSGEGNDGWQLNSPSGWVLGWGSTTITLNRSDAGMFNSASFNATSYNRGWITITYVG